MLSARSGRPLSAYSWEEIWEAGPYYERVSQLLDQAEHSVVIVGWQIDSRLKLTSSPETLKEQILRICAAKPNLHIYLLLWDHAYFYVVERESWQGHIWDELHPQVHLVFDNRHPFGASHHEKICIFDGKTALLGGVDLCDARWDSPHHFYSDPRRSLEKRHEAHVPYHDISVQVTGPIVSELMAHVARRWNVLSTLRLPESPSQNKLATSSSYSSSAHTVYLSHTFAPVEKIGYGKITRDIEFLFLELIAKAQSSLYIENQFYWSQGIHDALIARMRSIYREKRVGLKIIIVLANPILYKGATRLMRFYEFNLVKDLLRVAEETHSAVFVGIPFSFSPDTAQAKPVFIHSKLIVVDDQFLSIGSANLSLRSFRVDTETQVTFAAQNKIENTHVQRFLKECEHHWGIHWNEATRNFDLTTTQSVHLRPFTSQKLPPIETPELIQNILHWLMDPPIPYFHWVKHKLMQWMAHSKVWPSLILAIAWMYSFSSILYVSLFPDFSTHFIISQIACAFFLSNILFVRLSFLAVIAVATLFIDPSLVAKQAVISIWMNAFIGYCAARVFPIQMIRVFGKLIQNEKLTLPRAFSFKQIPTALIVALDPRISLRTKILQQGFQCVPAPWMVFSYGIVLPSFAYGFCFLLSLIENFIMKGWAH